MGLQWERGRGIACLCGHGLCAGQLTIAAAKTSSKTHTHRDERGIVGETVNGPAHQIEGTSQKRGKKKERCCCAFSSPGVQREDAGGVEAWHASAHPEIQTHGVRCSTVAPRLVVTRQKACCEQHSSAHNTIILVKHRLVS